eukprot:108104-Chlamydomonas_euryale.AAC.1
MRPRPRCRARCRPCRTGGKPPSAPCESSMPRGQCATWQRKPPPSAGRSRRCRTTPAASQHEQTNTGWSLLEDRRGIKRVGLLRHRRSAVSTLELRKHKLR